MLKKWGSCSGTVCYFSTWKMCASLPGEGNLTCHLFQALTCIAIRLGGKKNLPIFQIGFFSPNKIWNLMHEWGKRKFVGRSMLPAYPTMDQSPFFWEQKCVISSNFPPSQATKTTLSSVSWITSKGSIFILVCLKPWGLEYALSFNSLSANSSMSFGYGACGRKHVSIPVTGWYGGR